MSRIIKIFYNFSVRSSPGVLISSKNIIKWFKSQKYILTYNAFKNGSASEIYSSEMERLEYLFESATQALKDSDLCILEISTHSLSQGYLLQKALEEGKPTIALHLPNCLPVFVAGIHDSRLQVVEYTPAKMIAVLKEAINYASEDFDIRFNMMLSPTLNSYLKQLAKQKNMSRSSCVRAMIRENMVVAQARMN